MRLRWILYAVLFLVLVGVLYSIRISPSSTSRGPIQSARDQTPPLETPPSTENLTSVRGNEDPEHKFVATLQRCRNALATKNAEELAASFIALGQLLQADQWGAIRSGLMQVGRTDSDGKIVLVVAFALAVYSPLNSEDALAFLGREDLPEEFVHHILDCLTWRGLPPGLGPHKEGDFWLEVIAHSDDALIPEYVSEYIKLKDIGPSGFALPLPWFNKIPRERCRDQKVIRILLDRAARFEDVRVIKRLLSDVEYWTSEVADCAVEAWLLTKSVAVRTALISILVDARGGVGKEHLERFYAQEADSTLRGRLGSALIENATDDARALSIYSSLRSLETDPALKSSFLDAIATRGGTDALNWLYAQARNGTPAERAEVMRSFSKARSYGRQQKELILLESLEAPEPLLRVAAIETLAQMDPVKYMDRIRDRAKGDSSEEVRKAAQAIIDRWK